MAANLKRSIILAGRKTSVSLEDEFWQGVREIADARGYTLSQLIGEIDHAQEGANLSSSVRLHVLDHYRRRARFRTIS